MLTARPLLTVFVAVERLRLASAGVNVAEITFAKETLDAGDFGFGLLIGGERARARARELPGRLRDRRAPDRRRSTARASARSRVGARGAAVAPRLDCAPLRWWSSASATAIAVVCNALLVQRGAPDELRGRAFTIIMSTNYAVLGLSMVSPG